MTKYDFPTYLINLEDDIERRQSSLEQLHKIDIHPIIVPAYNEEKVIGEKIKNIAELKPLFSRV